MNNQHIKTNGIRLNVNQDGPNDGELVILLHGFPEFSHGWKKQIPYLVSAGYKVWAPDQRGYNLSDKPKGISAYTLDILADDVVGLIDAAGEKQVHLVGHDWGGAVAWHFAAKYPDKVKKLVLLNIPHGSVMQKYIRTNKSQRRKSWYFFAFQVPWFPEFFARRKNWGFPADILMRTSRKGTFSETDLALYRQAWSQPKAFKSMLNWYRAIIQKPPASPTSPRITVPTLLIWGSKDRFFEIEMAQKSIDLCDDGKLVMIDEATHWVQHEEPDRVNNLISSFIKE